MAGDVVGCEIEFFQLLRIEIENFAEKTSFNKFGNYMRYLERVHLKKAERDPLAT